MSHERPVPWFANLMAAEQLCAEALKATVLTSKPPPTVRGSGLHMRRRYRKRLSAAGINRWGFEPEVGPSEPFDILFVFLNDASELTILDAMEDSWVDLAPTRVLFQGEVWSADVDESLSLIQAVNGKFTHMFTAAPSARARYVDAIGDKVTVVSPLVDISNFTPAIGRERPIDVYNFGRRDPGQHDALLEWSDDDAWYHYDTTRLGDVIDLRTHQRVLGRVLGESSFTVCNFARFDQPHRTLGVREVGPRYYEAMAAGCLILGDHADTEIFDRDLAGLPGIIDFPLGAADVPDAFRSLMEDRAERVRLSAQLRAEVCLKHDISHRLETMFDVVGIEVPEHLRNRQRALAAEAERLLQA